jgi:tetratricopeptide (TPR) repeat protein
MSRRRLLPDSASKRATFARLIAAAWLLAALVAPAAVAQEAWKKNYNDAVHEFAGKQPDYVAIGQKLMASIDDRSSPTKHGPNVIISSQQRGYIPEFYLAQICVKTGRPEDALQFVEQARSYLSDRDELAVLTKTAEEAHRLIADRTPATRGAPPPITPPAPAPGVIASPPPAAAAPAPVNPPAPDPAAAKLAEFNNEIAAATRAAAAGNFAEARAAAERARRLGVDSPRVDALEADIRRREQANLLEEAQQALKKDFLIAARIKATQARALGGDTTLADSVLASINSRERAVPAATAPAAQERAGMRAFLSGDYRAAIDVLKDLAPRDPRARLYVATSEAALALLETDTAKKAALTSDAQRDWAAIAGARATFDADLQYVSPEIRRILGISQ